MKLLLRVLIGLPGPLESLRSNRWAAGNPLQRWFDLLFSKNMLAIESAVFA